MARTSKNLLLLSAVFSALTCSVLSASDTVEVPSTAGKKEPFKVKRGDCELTFGGKAKVENYFEKNAYLLNKNIPDENMYFKETVDLTFDVVYGMEKFGHKAAEFFAGVRHKGIWGKALNYADRDAGPIGPSNIKFNDRVESVFGSHAHTSGKALLWFKDAWFSFSLNAATGWGNENLHYLKLGWFPFDMGRGIALGGFYGLNKELLSLYSYPEDKAAPGINLHGKLADDSLEYDLYYSRFEERGKSLEDTINLEKRNLVGRRRTPWRGVAKNDELFAARLKWRPIRESVVGDLEFEPYVFYNAASDQKIEISPDCRVNWGSYGLAVEHSLGGFECGAEFAMNYGKQRVYALDRNIAWIQNRGGFLVEEYNNVNNPDGTPAKVTAASRLASIQPVYTNGAAINKANGALIDTDFVNSATRFRPAYTNKLQGWMAVVDGAYTFDEYNFQLALAYGYASGDKAPNSREGDKKYNGFVGLHELYSGKRVTSIFLLDQRLLKRPTNLDVKVNEPQGPVAAKNDTTFSDLQHVGIGATWTPNCSIKKLSLNPNIVAFWKAKEEFKVKFVPNQRNPDLETLTISDEYASTYMGTELNILAECAVITDLKLFANAAVFFPGTYFKDVKGVPVGKDIFDIIVQDDLNDRRQADRFRISSDTAYHLNVGLEFKF